jgi:hypothetical protein
MTPVADLALYLPYALFEPFVGTVHIVSIVLSFFTALLWIATIIVIPFGCIRAFRASRRRSVESSVNPPTPNAEATPDSN